MAETSADEKPGAAEAPKEGATETWEELGSIVEKGDSAEAKEYINALPEGEPARALSHLSVEEQKDLLTLLPNEAAADLLEEIPDAQAVHLLGQLPPNEAAAIVEELPSDGQADLVGGLEEATAEAILDEMAPWQAAGIRELVRHDPHTAGGLMITEFLSYHEDQNTDDVVDDLRDHAEEYSHYEVQYSYVLDAEGRLAGVLRLRSVVLSRRGTPLRSIMVRDPLHVPVTATLEELRRFFERHSLIAVPVTNAEGRLVGVVRQAEVRAASEEVTSRTFMRFAGILTGDEFRSLPLRLRCTRRLSWLSINIVLNIMAASVIALYQDTLSQAIALAAFLPIVSDMSGCSGNQAVAVSMRELVLGLIRPRDFLYVLRKETGLGLINGLVLGLLLGAVALVWTGNPVLGSIVAFALAANTLVAVSVGACVPIAFHALKLDPGLASGPILTTITDMCGFFFVLSLATQLLPYLAG
jgi:magnesium transporter